MTSNEQRLSDLRKSFENLVTDPKIAGTVDKFYDREETYSGLWLSAEGGNLIDGIQAFDYYEYDGGINGKVREWAENNNAIFEFYDAGTIMLYLQQ